jgi:hypothetical protein
LTIEVILEKGPASGKRSEEISAGRAVKKHAGPGQRVKSPPQSADLFKNPVGSFTGLPKNANFQRNSHFFAVLSGCRLETEVSKRLYY